MALKYPYGVENASGTVMTTFDQTLIPSAGYNIENQRQAALNTDFSFSESERYPAQTFSQEPVKGVTSTHSQCLIRELTN